jgi:hypothetical protein
MISERDFKDQKIVTIENKVDLSMRKSCIFTKNSGSCLKLRKHM